MPWESIGSVSGDGFSEQPEWIEFCSTLALSYLQFACGAPPEGSEVGVFWQDHDFGSYPALGVWSEGSPDFEYVRRCEVALERFDGAIAWERICPELEDESDERDGDEPNSDDCGEADNADGT